MWAGSMQYKSMQAVLDSAYEELKARSPIMDIHSVRSAPPSETGSMAVATRSTRVPRTEPYCQVETFL
eukprot:3060408-Pyramimonas_sp.AAC.1